MAFEKEYYESDAFWNDSALSDKGNKIRIIETTNLIPNEIKSLADIGCGNGVFIKHLQSHKKYIRIMGIDRSEEALKHLSCEKLLGDIESIPLADNSYECVTCLQVLEHLPNDIYKNALKELVRISSKYILVSVPFNEIIEKNSTQCPSCKTIFNADLHLRSYDERKIDELFNDYNVKLVQKKNVIREISYSLFEILHKLRNNSKGKNKDEFKSPICPLCGFKNPNFGRSMSQKYKNIKSSKLKRFIINFIKFISVKKQTDGYWMIALYKK